MTLRTITNGRLVDGAKLDNLPADTNQEIEDIETILATIPVKATGAEINTGTNDTKFATPKAITDSNVVFTTKTQTLTNKTLTSPVVNTPTGIVKGDVGLGNVDNTSDATKNSATATLTNKRITERLVTTTSSTTPTPNADTTDIYEITALAGNAVFVAPTGTPTNGQKLKLRITDNGTARTLSFPIAYNDIYGTTLPTTTVAGATTEIFLCYNSYDSTWIVADVIVNTPFSNVTGLAPDFTSGPTTVNTGFSITPKKNVKIVSATKNASCTATRCQLIEFPSLTLLGSTSFSGNVATFTTPIAINSGQNLWVVADNSGGNYVFVSRASYVFDTDTKHFLIQFGIADNVGAAAGFNFESIQSF